MKMEEHAMKLEIRVKILSELHAENVRITVKIDRPSPDYYLSGYCMCVRIDKGATPSATHKAR